MELPSMLSYHMLALRTLTLLKLDVSHGRANCEGRQRDLLVNTR
jgi:hypothetical protein